MLILFFLSGSTVCAQQYSYRHYDIKDGLAGSTVYDLYQDKEGFIWFATETGLSRFDGTHFKNFTTKDGLPDNTIVSVKGDRQGRVWLLPFKNSICYYYKGKIHNQQNDPLLKKIQLLDVVTEVRENRNGDILISDAVHIYHIDRSNKLNLIYRHEKLGKVIAKIDISDTGQFYLMKDYKIFTADTRNIKFRSNITHTWGGAEHIVLHDAMQCWMEEDSVLRVQSDKYHLKYRYTVPPLNRITPLNDSLLCLNSINGSILFNFVQRKIVERFLSDKNISSFLIDREGGYWFTSMNDGVYRLNSSVFKNIQGTTAKGQKLGVYVLEMLDGMLWAGSDMGYLQQIRDNKVRLISLEKQVSIKSKSNQVTAITKKGDTLVVGCGDQVFIKKGRRPFSAIEGYSSIKQIIFKDDKELIISGSSGLYFLPIKQDTCCNTIWSGRTTCLYKRNDSIWFGTLNGLYVVKPRVSLYNYGVTHPLLSKRISAIAAGANGILWVATIGDGIIGLQNNRIQWHINQSNGLSSNIARCLAIDTDCIWVGTDKGLNKIELNNGQFTITRYMSSDGLNSDIINTIFIHGPTIYTGTPEGITYFNKRETLMSSECDLKLTGVAVNYQEVPVAGNYQLKYGSNSIRFDYVAISMRSAGDIIYKYRLRGLDSSWKSTTQTFLELIALPPGSYTLELFAINKFGVYSKSWSVRLFVDKPFWQTTWFVAGCILLSTLITWFIVTQRNRRVARKEKARRQIEQQLLELEQKALRAQMNPHFIFNCLNSIQGFILDKDIATANMYLSQFASLIRQTLDNSFQSFIALADEIKYLTTYMHLEQMRGNHNFEYAIHIDPALDPATVFIPGMVLQPFIENAVHHGLKYKTTKDGLIDIHFFIQNAMLVCSIRDNGIGRKDAQRLKTKLPIAYKGRGMQLVVERIELINKNLENKISLSIIDHTGPDQLAQGTEIIIRFPIFNNDKYAT